MAKIDVSKIEGYKEMTPEQKLAALEAYELADPDYSGYVSKSVFDKKASEAAELSKQLKAKMTADEQAEAERAAAAKAMQDELETLRKEKAVSSLKAEYIALGYDAELAAKAAQAKADGDTNTELETMKLFLQAQKQAYIKEALEGTPRPPAGCGKNKLTSEQLNAMTDEEYYKTMNKKE